jgi:hypothetical protein
MPDFRLCRWSLPGHESRAGPRHGQRRRQERRHVGPAEPAAGPAHSRGGRRRSRRSEARRKKPVDRGRDRGGSAPRPDAADGAGVPPPTHPRPGRVDRRHRRRGPPVATDLRIGQQLPRLAEQLIPARSGDRIIAIAHNTESTPRRGAVDDGLTHRRRCRSSPTRRSRPAGRRRRSRPAARSTRHYGRPEPRHPCRHRRPEHRHHSAASSCPQGLISARCVVGE